MPQTDGQITSRDLCNQSVVQRVLGDESVSSIKIAANLESDNYNGGVVAVDPGSAGWRIERNTGDASFNNVNVRGTLNADDIVAGTLDVDRIDANTLTVEKLVIGNFDNLIQNPGFEQAGAVATTLTPYYSDNAGATGWYRASTSAARSGGFVAVYNPAGQTSEADLIGGSDTAYNDMTVQHQAFVGDTFHWEFYVRPLSGTLWNDVRARVVFYDENNVLTGSSNSAYVTPVAGVWTQVEVEGLAPSGTAYATFWVSVKDDSLSGLIMFDDLYARRKVGTLVIDDLAVDIARQLNPVHNEILFDEADNQPIDTTEQFFVSNVHSVPTWVGTAYIHATGFFQGSLSATGTQRLMSMRTEIAGDPSGGQFVFTIENPNTTKCMTVLHAREITAPGSTITCRVMTRVSVGTMNDNRIDLQSTFMGIR